MKKKFLSVLLATAMLGTLLTGCGDDGTKNDGEKDTGTTPVASNLSRRIVRLPKKAMPEQSLLL